MLFLLSTFSDLFQYFQIYSLYKNWSTDFVYLFVPLIVVDYIIYNIYITGPAEPGGWWGFSPSTFLLNNDFFLSLEVYMEYIYIWNIWFSPSTFLLRRACIIVYCYRVTVLPLPCYYIVYIV